MSEDKKSKKDDIEKLRMILDDPKHKRLNSKDNVHLNSVRKKLLGETSDEEEIRRLQSEFISKKSDTLKPQVTIYEKEEDSTTRPEIKQMESEEHKEQLKDETDLEEEDLTDAEELYEVEKVEIQEPEFLEIKPEKTTKKKEKTLVAEKKEITSLEQDFEKEIIKDTGDEDLPEWSPVDDDEIKSEVDGSTEDKEALQIEKSVEIDEVKKEILPVWEPVEAEEPKEIIDEKKPKPAVKTTPKKEEQVPVEKHEMEKIPLIVRDGKIDVFKDIKSIDGKTAALLYEQGFTSVDKIKDATVNDLTKIKEIKKRMAKKIKKEIDKISRETKEKEEELPLLVPVEEKEEELPKEKPVEAKEIKEELVEEEEQIPLIVRDGKTDVFKDIKSIDGKTAELLYENGFVSLEKLREATLKDIVKADIQRKLAKKIKKEITKLDKKIKIKSKKLVHRVDETVVKETEPDRGEVVEWDSFDLEEDASDEKNIVAYNYKDYALYKKEIETTTGKKRTIRFFSKKKPDIGEPVQLPKGYEVKINKKTGLPYLMKKE